MFCFVAASCSYAFVYVIRMFCACVLLFFRSYACVFSYCVMVLTLCVIAAACVCLCVLWFVCACFVIVWLCLCLLYV